MSYGVVICSLCKREVHLENRTWIHCEDGTALCNGANPIYPHTLADIRGKWCGRDDVSHWRSNKRRRQPNSKLDADASSAD